LAGQSVNAMTQKNPKLEIHQGSGTKEEKEVRPIRQLKERGSGDKLKRKIVALSKGEGERRKRKKKGIKREPLQVREGKLSETEEEPKGEELDKSPVKGKRKRQKKKEARSKQQPCLQ